MNFLIKYNPKALFFPTSLSIIAAYKQNKYIGLSAVAMTALIFWFHREPIIKMSMLYTPQMITSPAYGTIRRIHKDKQTNKISVEIFLSLSDIHVQYIPISNGQIVKQHYKSGEFNLAYVMTKSELNERFTTTIHTSDNNEVIVRQIAGMIARRIFNFVDTGDIVQRLQRIGFISFGSRVDCIMDADKVKLQCKVGQRVSPTDLLAVFV